tara:strand:- start:841 stop:951 length:111 start_codon:yes stop_codon:yes gene_type:complete
MLGKVVIKEIFREFLAYNFVFVGLRYGIITSEAKAL